MPVGVYPLTVVSPKLWPVEKVHRPTGPPVTRQ
jgi:hypothetical protein